MKKEDEKIKEEEKEIMIKNGDGINVVIKKENRRRKEGDGEEERIEYSDKIRIRNTDGDKLKKVKFKKIIFLKEQLLGCEE